MSVNGVTSMQNAAAYSHTTQSAAKEKTEPNRKNQYEIAIDVWTIRDIKKINTAIANNLNYIVFWNMTEFDNWINEYINQCK